MSEFIIRNATVKDVPFLVETIIEAEKSGTDKLSYSTVFGLSEEECKKYIAKMLYEEVDGCELSISSFMVAEKDGIVAAALSAFVEGSEGISSAILKGNLLNYTLPIECINKAVGINAILSEIHIGYFPNTIQIGAGYVAKEFRGNNLLRIINSKIIERLSKSHPDVTEVWAQIFDCNIPSIKTYEKENFQLVMIKESSNKEMVNYLPSGKKFLYKKDISMK
jgi:hypothetical protein